MRKLVLGFGAAALVAGVAFAGDQAMDNTRLAAADSASFAKLDADQDGRVSAIEAATDSKVAAGFTQADADKDGYLSKAEFSNLGRSSADDSQRGTSNTPRPQSDSSVPPEESTTAPPQ